MAVHPRSNLAPEQQALLDRLLPIADQVHESFVRKWRARYFQDDLRAIAHAAVHACALNFDEARGVPVEAYARSKLNWALIRAFKQESKHWPAARWEAYWTARAIVDDTDWLNDSDGRTREHIDGWLGEIAVSAALGIAGDLARMPAAAAAEARVPYTTLLDALDKAMGSLAEPDRNLIQMHYAEGLTWEAVANQIGQSERNVERRAALIRRKLAVHIELQQRNARGKR